MPLEISLIGPLNKDFKSLHSDGKQDLISQNLNEKLFKYTDRVFLRYKDSDTSLPIKFAKFSKMKVDFENTHKSRFGFISPEKVIIIESIQTEVSCQSEQFHSKVSTHNKTNTESLATEDIFINGRLEKTIFYNRDDIKPNEKISGPAVIIEPTSTFIIEPGWDGLLKDSNDLILTRTQEVFRSKAIGTNVDPIMLEIFNNLFMNVAEQMGMVLENTASSVNIKERLDFSCAVFSPEGELVANAPHVPVHLGSMSESIKTIIRENSLTMKSGDAFLINAPYNGGTHLPDITLIKPVFDNSNENVIFYVATRGHHADIGGTVPGSAPANSTHIKEEGC